jgi:Bacterial Ig-like domain (group 2)
VSSSGMVTLVKQGSATVTAAAGGITATAGVTVLAPPPPTVASVTVSPTTANATAGNSVQLTATAWDASGNVVPGAAVSWTSSNTGVGTVSGTGLVQALTVGTVIISATSGGHVATASVKIAAPSGGGTGGSTNEPSGMATQFNTGSISSFSQSGLTMIGGAQPTVVPSGTGLRVTYSPSLAGGNSPGELGTGDFANAGAGTIYVRYQSRTSPGFTTNGNTDIKNFEPHTFQEGAGNGEENHILALWAVGSSSQLSPLIGLQGPYSASNIHPSPAVIVSDGNWHTIEWLLVQDAPAGSGNGTAKVWVDGTQVINATGVTWLGSGNQSGWKALVCDPTYGGGTASPPSTMFWDFDQLYVSTK